MVEPARGPYSHTCNSDPNNQTRLKRLSTLSVLLLCCTTLLTGPALADDDDDDDDLLVLGVMGDSISDEYKAPNGGPFLGYEGYEWGSVLIHTRDVSFGRYRKKKRSSGNRKAIATILRSKVRPPRARTTRLTSSAFSLVLAIRVSPSLIRRRVWPEHSQENGSTQPSFKVVPMTSSYTASCPDLMNLLIRFSSPIRQGILDAYANALDTPVRRRGTLADEKVVVSTIPVFGPPDQQAGIESINAGIRDVATARGVPVFNTSDSLIEKIDFSDFTVVIGDYRFHRAPWPAATIWCRQEIQPL